MKFVAKERKTLDAFRWWGRPDDLDDVQAWCDEVGLKLSLEGLHRQANLCVIARNLVAMTLHGPVTIEPGAWAVYDGNDVSVLADSELQRLYDVDVEAITAKLPYDEADLSPEIREFLEPFGPARLGLASTRQLLTELESRLDSGERGARTAAAMIRGIAHALGTETLEYRTVEG